MGTAAEERAQAWRAHARVRLQEDGHRLGGARAAVIDALAGHDCCMSATELRDAAGDPAAQVGLASVYRALELLESLGLVRRVDLGDGRAKFEAVGPSPGEHHHHMVCVRCDAVLAFSDPALEQALHGAADRLGFAELDHDVVFRGVCGACREVGA